MPRRATNSSASRRLIGLLLAVTVTPAVLLIWFAVRLLSQDGDLLAQREVERRRAAAPAIVGSLQQAVIALEADLDKAAISSRVRMCGASQRTAARRKKLA